MSKKYIWKYSLKREKTGEFNEEEEPHDNPKMLADFVRGTGIQDSEQETLIVIILDTRLRIKGYSIVTIGLIDRAQAHAREVFRNAIVQGASKIALAHNHPSGDPEPSQGDIKMTKTLVEASKIIGIELIDHIIIGDTRHNRILDYISLREEGHIL